MLDVIERVEQQLPALLRGEWRTLFIDYHPPIVERVWRSWEQYRICLHRIHPCEDGKALFHPHPWPSAMRILSGQYEMAVGYGTGEQLPPVAMRLIVNAGCVYEMTDPNAWHYVRPLGSPAMSLMVTGRPWPERVTESKQLGLLSEEKKTQILDFFRGKYR